MGEKAIMMRILLLIDCLGPGGAQRQIVGLAKMLQEREYQIKVIYYRPIFFYRSYLDKYHIPNEFIAGPESKIKRLFLIAQSIRQFSPEVVISYLDAPNMMACFLKAIGMKFRLISSERNTSQSLNRGERLKYLFLRKADVIVPNSYSQERFIKHHFPRLCQKMHTIINFVDLDTYRPTFNKERGHVIVVAASAWQPKNTLGLIEAAKIVKEHRHIFTIKWFGIYEDTPYVRECQKKISEYGLRETFYLLPKTTSIAEEFQNADYFCLPSFYEGTPNALCEAMACGLPVICSRVCDNGNYVEEDVNGFLFDPHEPLEMADKIEKSLMLSDEKYYNCCKESRKIAEMCFSEERFFREYNTLLNDE